MDTAQRLAGHESFKGFDAQRKFTCGQGPLFEKPAGTQPWQLIVSRVFRTIDDPQVLASAALDRRLHQTPRTMRDEIERLHYHALAAFAGQLLPPSRGLLHGCIIADIHLDEWGRNDEPWIGRGQTA